MQKEIVAAIIGAGGGILAAVLPLTWTALAKRRGIHLSDRRGALLGRWEGQGTDNYVEDSRKPLFKFELIMDFQEAGRTIKADAVLSGVFYNEDYLQLSYYNKNLARKQLGVAVLRLGPDGNTLSGYYSGFSPIRETIVAGSILMEKKA
jgi:hypothetical protein